MVRAPKANRFALIALLTVVLFVVPALAADKDYNKECDVYQDVVYGHKHALAMTMDIVQPKKGNGAGIVWVVSGGWHSGVFPPQAAFSADYPYAGFFDCRALLDKGFIVFFLRHGDGEKFTMPEIVDDCRRGIRFIRLNAKKYGVDPDRLGALGGSAGGHLALMLATTSDEGVPNPKDFDWICRTPDRLATAVAYYPPTDIRDWWANGMVKHYMEAFKFDPKRGAEFSPLLQVTPWSAPAFMVHGDKDVITIKYSQDMVAAYKKNGATAELLTIKGVGHGFDIGFKGFKDYTPEQLKILDTTRSATVAWFEKTLLAKKKEPAKFAENIPAAAPATKLAKEYAYVDLSKGVNGPWPVTELDKAPDDLLKDEAWRTTKLLLRRVSADKFVMGNPDRDPIDEQYVREYHAPAKQHTVTLSKAFYMAVFPTTQEQWTRVMGANPSYFSGNPKRPVETVSWNEIRGGKSRGDEPEAKSFVGRLRKGSSQSFDLPTEAQWEYACRAGTTRALNDPSANKGEGADCSDAAMEKIGWFAGNSDRQTHDVGLKVPNAWGLYDMCGNVSQWCTDGLADYSGDATDPTGPGPEKPGGRITRGGYWSMPAAGCRSSARNYDASAPNEWGNVRYNVCGFRLMLQAE